MERSLSGRGRIFLHPVELSLISPDTMALGLQDGNSEVGAKFRDRKGEQAMGWDNMQ